jgi:hypothetical protein
MSLSHELFGAWCAPIFTLLTAVGWLGLGHFYHAPEGNISAAALDHFYASHRTAEQIGLSLFAISCIPLALYTIELTIVLWRREATPLFSFAQLLGGFGVVMLVFISCCLWLGCAYRAGATDPHITVALNDASWFGFLVGWVILTLQMIGCGIVTVRDDGPDPIAPKWVGWATIVGAIALVTANGCAFAKSGIWGWSGLLGFYVPVAIWGVWLDGYAFLIRRDVLRRRGAVEAGASAPSARSAAGPALAGPALTR